MRTAAYTRKGREQWKAEHDSQGRLTAPWAEKFLLGSLIIEFDRHALEIDELESRHFEGITHQVVFSTMREMQSEQVPIDIPSMADRLASSGRLIELPGGIQYLLELCDQAEGRSTDHIVEWCHTIRSNCAIRSLRNEIQILEAVIDRGADPESLRPMVSRLSELLPTERRIKETTLREASLRYADNLGRGILPTLKVAIPEIDHAIGGAAPGEMIIIGGRPSHGKSMVMLQWLDEASANGVRCLLVSEEMSIENLAERQVRRILPVDVVGTDTQRVNFEISSHFQAREEVIIAEACGTIDAAERVIESAVRRHGIKIAAVDYVQLLGSDKKTAYERVSEASTRMKRLATKHGLIMLVLAQLNRGIAARSDGIPQSSDLKDSGQLEQDADVILCPFWPAMHKPEYPNPYEYRIYQLKNRNRGIGEAIITMKVNPQRQRLEGTEVTW